MRAIKETTPPPREASKYFIDEMTGATYKDGVLVGFARIEFDIEEDKEILIIDPIWNHPEFNEK